MENSYSALRFPSSTPIYSLENLVTNKITDFHALLLSEYHHDNENSDIHKVAKIDEEFQDISSVLNHRKGGFIFALEQPLHLQDESSVNK